VTSTFSKMTMNRQQSINCEQYMELDESLRVHVGNIPFLWTIEDLRNQFLVFGPVRDPEIVSNERGSKGFGFITFLRREDGFRAIAMKNSTIADGRKITVALASSRPQKTAPSPLLPRALLRARENLQFNLPSTKTCFNTTNPTISSLSTTNSAMASCWASNQDGPFSSNNLFSSIDLSFDPYLPQQQISPSSLPLSQQHHTHTHSHIQAEAQQSPRTNSFRTVRVAATRHICCPNCDVDLSLL